MNMNIHKNKKGVGFIIGVGILIILGILVFTFAVILMKNVTDYGKNLTQDHTNEDPQHWDPDYIIGATLEEKKEMIKNLTISPNELSG